MLAWLATIGTPTGIAWWIYYLPPYAVSQDDGSAVAYAVYGTLATFIIGTTAAMGLVCSLVFTLVLIPRNLTQVGHFVVTGLVVGTVLAIFSVEFAGPLIPPAGGAGLGLLFWCVAYWRR